MSKERAASLAGIGVVSMLLAGLIGISAQIWARAPEGVPGAALAARAETDAGPDLNSLPATAAGVPEARMSDLGGRRLVGLVRNLYVRVADNVLLDTAHTPGTLITPDTAMFADVEFVELLPNGAEAMRAQLIDISGVQVGDVVNIRVAHKDNPGFFPVKEVTRVTELVAKGDTMLARDFNRRIKLARLGLSPLQAMLRTKQEF